MAAVSLTQNGLNVEYVPSFFNKEQSDEYLRQLRELPFYTPTLRIRGKDVRPNRLMLGYGDPDLCYKFSGTCIEAEPWTPLMLKLRDEVEKFSACSFNFVLLNLYPDGSSSIAQHKDNESGLDHTFPITVLSFGAERTIEFKRTDTPSTFLKLGHGSLYSMHEPTNRFFTHGIAPEPEVKTVRISLTFRRLIPNPKKPRLDLSTKQNCDSSSGDPQKCLQQKDDDDLQLPQNDWLSKTYKKAEAITPVLNDWNLNSNTLIQIVMDSNFNLRLHIRVFNENKCGQLVPTKTGVVLTQLTWFDLQSKISKINFRSCSESFIANNQLMCACINEESMLFQQMFPLNGLGFFLKPTVLKLHKDQILNLTHLRSEINEFLIEALLTIQLPKLILSKPSICNSHLSFEESKKHYFKCICSEIIACVYDTIECDACKIMSPNQDSHICTRPIFENYTLNRQNVLLQVNIQKIVENIRQKCSCFLDALFFAQVSFKKCMLEIEQFLIQYKETL